MGWTSSTNVRTTRWASRWLKKDLMLVSYFFEMVIYLLCLVLLHCLSLALSEFTCGIQFNTHTRNIKNYVHFLWLLCLQGAWVSQVMRHAVLSWDFSPLFHCVCWWLKPCSSMATVWTFTEMIGDKMMHLVFLIASFLFWLLYSKHDEQNGSIACFFF